MKENTVAILIAILTAILTGLSFGDDFYFNAFNKFIVTTKGKWIILLGLLIIGLQIAQLYLGKRFSKLEIEHSPHLPAIANVNAYPGVIIITTDIYNGGNISAKDVFFEVKFYALFNDTPTLRLSVKKGRVRDIPKKSSLHHDEPIKKEHFLEATNTPYSGLLMYVKINYLNKGEPEKIEDIYYWNNTCDRYFKHLQNDEKFNRLLNQVTA